MAPVKSDLDSTYEHLLTLWRSGADSTDQVNRTMPVMTAL
jgi:hypothetical protein